MSVVKKKKHVSKKNKKAWRKHCDITDVEAFLEDQRLEERLGKFEVKPDAELFVVDTAGDEVKVKEERPLTAKAKKRAKLAETPKCYEVLIPSSKVQDPNAKRNHVNPTGTKPTALSKLKEKRRIEKGIYEKKAELAKKNRKMALNQKRKMKSTRQNFGLDLWGQDLPEAKGIPSTLVDDFVSTEAQLHNVLPERRLRPKPPLAKTVVNRKAVELPHPGVSYNPSFKEHQELLQQVVQHEEKIIKRGEHLQRVTTGMFSKVTVQEKENQWREEMNLNEQPHNPADESGSDSEYRAVNPPVQNKKKDHKARRKQKERLLEKERLKREKIDKKKITDLYKLRKLQSSITTKEQTQEKVRELRSTKRAEKAETAPPALNKNKPPQKEPDFVDPADLSGNLTRLAPSTNLLRERFESLQHRGALAATKLMMKKKRRVKSYFKPGHKVTDKEIERYINKKDIK
ncbi:ribosome biogenesis protein NOP53 [Cydia fagiglandana]|uniref:ribosome biogenesis protein NOP53 n=1 Tax=Cydia fagiglandana TaxID=1458189 RepID=UPI002FEE1309